MPSSPYPFTFTDRVALITGAGSGIGRATALALADAGVKLIVCDLAEVGLGEVTELLQARGRLLMSQRVDVADRAGMQAFADAVHKKVAAVDILINNAGVGLGGGLLEISLKDWDWVMSINLGGVMHGCHFFIPKMVERGQGGHVVNVSSLLGYICDHKFFAYCAAKFGVIGLSEALIGELRPHGIGVSVICPGMINTPIVKTGRFGSESKRDVEKQRSHAIETWRKRGYPPEKVASAILAAIRHNRAFVPVAPEAWLSYFLKRVSPGLTRSLGRFLERQILLK
jgi:NAD(P)-dependent dehydrogenase (short-subunit alcohol dehydrogenase family)